MQPTHPGVNRRVRHWISQGRARRTRVLAGTVVGKPAAWQVCLLLQSEAGLQCHLEMGNVAIDNMATRFDHFEPVQVLDGFGSA